MRWNRVADLLAQVAIVFMQGFADLRRRWRQIMFGQHRRQPANRRLPNGQTDAELKEKSVYLVGFLGAITDRRLTHPMQNRQALLSTVLGDKNRNDGREAASQMASASTKSFLSPLMKGAQAAVRSASPGRPKR